MKPRRLGAAAVLAACAVGCGSSDEWSSRDRYGGPSSAYGWYGPADGRWRVATDFGRRDAPPEHGLSDAEVAAALAALEARRDDAPRAEEVLPPADAPVAEAAAEVAASYRRGDRERARALIAAHPRLLDWSDPGVVVSCRFAGSRDGIELLVVRSDTSLGAPREALAVCFEPGTYGVPAAGAGAEPLTGRGGRWTTPDAERRFGTWPSPQDLALLRAPVVVIPAGEAMAVTYVPVACASFHRGAPDVGTPYALARFPAGSAADRLMTVLCQGDEAPPDAEAQLAVWLARDDISWSDFVHEGGDLGRLVTFRRATPVRAVHAPGAARLLLEAGVDPRPLRFFDPTGGEPRHPAAPDEPAAEPPPAEPEPPATTPSELS